MFVCFFLQVKFINNDLISDRNQFFCRENVLSKQLRKGNYGIRQKMNEHRTRRLLRIN